MEKYSVYIILAVLLCGISPSNLQARPETNSYANDSIKNVELSEVKYLLNRLDTINAMNKDGLNYLQKKKLRKEVRVIKGLLREQKGATYLSASALVIILLVPLIVFHTID